MKHIVFYSGGIGSWATAKRVIGKQGKENVILLFTDTKIEDDDLYRFINETVSEMGCEYVYLADGRTPWEVFKDVRFLGNSRLAHCSHLLKQEIAHKWVVENFKPNECVLYLGIDWTESHRKKAPIENYYPYKVRFPMCEEPYVSKDEMISDLEKLGINQPRLYKRGYTHNNCGGFCVRAGQGHFAHLLKDNPELYNYHEQKEQEMIEFLGKDIAILKRSKVEKKLNQSGKMYKEKVVTPLTLKQLRIEIESKQTKNIDFNDIGGCGCFVTNESEDI